VCVSICRGSFAAEGTRTVIDDADGDGVKLGLERVIKKHARLLGLALSRLVLARQRLVCAKNNETKRTRKRLGDDVVIANERVAVVADERVAVTADGRVADVAGVMRNAVGGGALDSVVRGGLNDGMPFFWYDRVEDAMAAVTDIGGGFGLGVVNASTLPWWAWNCLTGCAGGTGGTGGKAARLECASTTTDFKSNFGLGTSVVLMDSYVVIRKDS